MANHSRPFESDTFTFEVGTEKKLFIIHKRVVENHSLALAALMNNGAMEESLNGVARLEEVEPAIFMLLVEFFYTGMYRVPVQPAANGSRPIYSHQMICESCSSRIGWDPRCKPPRNCPNCENEDTVRFKDNTHLNCVWTMSYPGLGMSDEALKQHLERLHPPDVGTDRVSYHAKLLMLAQMYLVKDLPELCLHKLRRDLMGLIIDSNSVLDVIKLIQYTYDITNASGEVVPQEHIFQAQVKVNESKEDILSKKMRDLVTNYAVAYAGVLIEHAPFRSMLNSGGNLVVELFREAVRGHWTNTSQWSLFTSC